jgi:hypothetical protein
MHAESMYEYIRIYIHTHTTVLHHPCKDGSASRRPLLWFTHHHKHRAVLGGTRPRPHHCRLRTRRPRPSGGTRPRPHHCRLRTRRPRPCHMRVHQDLFHRQMKQLQTGIQAVTHSTQIQHKQRCKVAALWCIVVWMCSRPRPGMCMMMMMQGKQCGRGLWLLASRILRSRSLHIRAYTHAYMHTCVPMGAIDPDTKFALIQHLHCLVNMHVFIHAHKIFWILG